MLRRSGAITIGYFREGEGVGDWIVRRVPRQRVLQDGPCLVHAILCQPDFRQGHLKGNPARILRQQIVQYVHCLVVLPVLEIGHGQAVPDSVVSLDVRSIEVGLKGLHGNVG